MPDQHVHDDSDLRKYRTELPNMADDEMDPYQYRLYGHYKRVCGANGGSCYESVRTTASTTKMSLAKVVETRKWLEDNGWIVVEEGVQGRQTLTIRIRDRWLENVMRYAPPQSPVKSTRNRGDAPQTDTGPVEAESVRHTNKAFATRTKRSPHEQSVRHTNERKNVVKNKPIKKEHDDDETSVPTDPHTLRGDPSSVARSSKSQSDSKPAFTEHGEPPTADGPPPPVSAAPPAPSAVDVATAQRLIKGYNRPRTGGGAIDTQAGETPLSFMDIRNLADLAVSQRLTAVELRALLDGIATHAGSFPGWLIGTVLQNGAWAMPRPRKQARASPASPHDPGPELGPHAAYYDKTPEELEELRKSVFLPGGGLQ